MKVEGARLSKRWEEELRQVSRWCSTRLRECRRVNDDAIRRMEVPRASPLPHPHPNRGTET